MAPTRDLGHFRPRPGPGRRLGRPIPWSTIHTASLSLSLSSARAVPDAIFSPVSPAPPRSGKFDLDCYDAFLDDQIKNGVQGVIVGGTTGEGQLMSWDEHIMLIAHTVNTFGREIQVIGNTGSNSTREALHATEQGFNVGMHASLQINPYYGKTSVDGMKEHFRRRVLSPN